MSSESDVLRSAVVELQLNDYTSVAIITAVAYDYVLTFSQEIEYIWCKPWTWVSTLFIPVRYFSLFNLVASALVGSSFLPNSAKTYLKGQVFDITSGWAFLFFLGAADFVMILRLWAMYNRSKFILWALLVLLSAEITATTLAVVVGSIPKNLPAEIIQILDFSVCTVQASLPTWTNVAVALQLAQGGVMCILVIIQSVRQSLELYRATTQWRLNRYMTLLVRQGVLAFLSAFLFNLVNILYAFGMAPTGGWQLSLMILLEYVPIYTLTPRFILSIRKLYALDARRGFGIDTGFGLSSSGHNGGRMAIVFADIGGSDASEDTQETPTEGLEAGEMNRDDQELRLVPSSL